MNWQNCLYICACPKCIEKQARQILHKQKRKTMIMTKLLRVNGFYVILYQLFYMYNLTGLMTSSLQNNLILTLLRKKNI